MKGLSWTNLVLGLWLALAPFALTYSGTTAAVWEDVIVGLLIAALALWRALGEETEGMAAVSWTVAALGVWAIIAPFALGYSGITAAVWNDVIVGLVVAGIATFRAVEKPHGGAVRMKEQHHGAH
ncbi:MAG: SPW repeat protein [Candidatus Binatia bacterium]